MIGQNATPINVNDRRELAIWSRRFGVTAEQLRRAVKQVGSEIDALARYFGKPGMIPRRTS
jgi:uncharacterized protein DUF3606